MIKKFADLHDLNHFAAEKFIEIGAEAIKKRGQFAVALAGGSTPKSLYQLLATDKFQSQIDWSKVFFFFGDERNVLPDSLESNFRMANENLFVPLQIPSENIFRWNTELADTEKISEDYELTIKKFFNLTNDALPRFDLILLGMGDDGHTASLFPFTEALNEIKKIAAVNWVEKLKTKRLTFTFPTINNAANVIFLIKSADKAETLQTVLEGKYQPEKFPAQAVKLTDGDLIWLVEKEAAKFLK